MVTGPLQYAGTVYSIGEYGYHLAVNKKTPDVVINEKLAALGLKPKSAKTAEAPVMVADNSPAKRRIAQRNAQLASLELRRMAFLKATADQAMYLGDKAAPVNLAYAADGDVSLD